VNPVFFLGLLFSLIACQPSQPPTKPYPFSYSAMTMGTSFSIKATTLPDSIAVKALQQQIDALLIEINGQMSTYQQDSELSIFNRLNSTEWQTVSEPLYLVLKTADDISQLSDGAFDITVSPLVNLWGFGPDPSVIKAPPAIDIQQKLSIIGYRHLHFNPENYQVKKDFIELSLDLSALAKGYAVDKIAELLEQYTIDDYLVEIGGEIRLSGHNISGKPWRIAIEKPDANQRVLQKVLEITDVAVATSGDYRNFFEVDGVRFSHTIDLRTGYPINHPLASVTIMAENTMRADALATAFMVIGAEAGLQLAEQHNIAALFIIKTKQGFIEKASSLFNKRIGK